MFTEIDMDGLHFSNVTKSEYSETYVGFSDNYIIKIEQAKCGAKYNDLLGEIRVIRELNNLECVSCPRLLTQGRLESGQVYCIQERIKPACIFNYADMVFSILEQKCLGVSQADFRQQNLIFDSSGICYIIDYDQARIGKQFIKMNVIDYFGLFDNYLVGVGYDKNKIVSLFRNGSFNLAATTIMHKQITTNTDTGIYHSINTPELFIDGARSLNARSNLLDLIEFKKDEKVLDVGCNMGLLSHYLYDRGCQVTGFDMDLPITRVAKMVANILGKKITFFQYDLDSGPFAGYYDTICLFSVIHHAKNFPGAASNVARCCNRIIIECKFNESGSKYINGGWAPASSWSCQTLPELIGYLEKHFSGFKFEKHYGVGDRDRHIMSFRKTNV